jgi:uncharacterized protein (DUF2237 family)
MYSASPSTLRLQAMTGFYRTGCCETGPDDHGVHHPASSTLLSRKHQGSRQRSPHPHFLWLRGLPGDRWCVCAARWLQVQQAGAACSIVLEATHENTLKIVPFELLIQYAVIPTQLN